MARSKRGPIVALGLTQAERYCGLLSTRAAALYLRRSDEQSGSYRYPGSCGFRIGGRASVDDSPHAASRKRRQGIARNCRPAADTPRRADGVVSWPEFDSAEANTIRARTVGRGQNGRAGGKPEGLA